VNEAAGVHWHDLPSGVLTNEQANLVQSLVNSGRYQNASEGIRDGLRLIEQREAEDAARLQALRDATNVGIAALECDAFKEFSDARSFETYLNRITIKMLGGGARRP
jgi:antitoxin ParD1/3/4